MADSGTVLQSFTIAKTLSLVPAPLLIGVLASAAAALLPRAKLEAKAAGLALLCAAAALLSLVLAIFHVVKLLAQPESQRYLFCQLAQAVRIGSFDASLALVLDPVAAPLLLATSSIGAAVLLALAIDARRAPPSKAALLASCLFLAAMQMLLLASGFFLLFLAWSALVVAGVALLGRRASSAAAGIGQVLLVAAAALLFWLYGGGWHDEDYVPAMRPRMIAAQVDAAGGREGTALAKGGQLSLRALPGTRIGLAGAELCAVDASGRPGGIGLSARPCREPARSPFARLPIPAAIHDFHLYAGHGTNELEIKKVRIEAGRETLVTLIGPTLDFRELRDQLAVSEPAGEKAVRRTLQSAEIAGLPALSLALLLLVLATAIKFARVPGAWSQALAKSPPAVAGLVSGLSAVAGVYLLARLDFLLAFAPWIAALGTGLGCVIAVRAAAGACVERAGRRAALLVSVAHGGIAFGGVAAGSAGSSVFYLAVASAAACSFALVSAEHQPTSKALARARWLGALALSAAPLPVLLVMLQKLSADEGARTLPGALIAALLAAGSGVIAFAVWCGHYRAPGKAAKLERRAPADFNAHAAAGVALLTLAAGMVGGYLQGFDPSRPAVLASLALPLYGWAAARRRHAKPGSDGPAHSPLLHWLGAAPEQPALDGWISRFIDSIGSKIDRIEQILYAPLGTTRAAERQQGER